MKWVKQYEIKGAGGTINYPTENIMKALTEAGLNVKLI